MCDGVSMTTYSWLLAVVRMIARSVADPIVSASSGLEGARSTRTSAGPVARTLSSSAASTFSPCCARSARERRWCSTWSMPAASPNWRSTSTSADRLAAPPARVTARLVAIIEVPVPPFPEKATTTLARPRGARISRRGVSLPATGTSRSTPSRLAPPGGTSPAAIRMASTSSAPPADALIARAVQASAASGASPDVISSTRVDGDTELRCPAKSAAGSSAKRSWSRSTSGWRSHASSITADAWCATPHTSTTSPYGASFSRSPTIRAISSAMSTRITCAPRMPSASIAWYGVAATSGCRVRRCDTAFTTAIKKGAGPMAGSF